MPAKASHRSSSARSRCWWCSPHRRCSSCGRVRFCSRALFSPCSSVPAAISRGVDVHVARERTFFGVYRIVETDGVRSFFHGTTLHGSQWPRADGSIESRSTYYGIGTPYFELLSSLTRRPSPLVIGLAGARHRIARVLCASRRRGARLRDRPRCRAPRPGALRSASRLRAECENRHRRRPASPRARASLLDFLALDTFSSDSIPVHLLTLEALRIYLRVLALEGVLAVHVSNRHLDLEPVLAALAERLGLVARIKRYRTPKDAPPPACDIVRRGGSRTRRGHAPDARSRCGLGPARISRPGPGMDRRLCECRAPSPLVVVRSRRGLSDAPAEDGEQRRRSGLPFPWLFTTPRLDDKKPRPGGRPKRAPRSWKLAFGTWRAPWHRRRHLRVRDPGSPRGRDTEVSGVHEHDECATRSAPCFQPPRGFGRRPCCESTTR